MDSIIEPARSVPVVRHCDVLVAGGGPAGAAAAWRAAAAGADTVLIEAAGAPGGMWTGGLLGWILDGDKPGSVVLQTLYAELVAMDRGAPAPDGSAFAFEPEAMKTLLDRCLADAGVHVRLETRVTAAARERSGALAAVITESKSGREAWAARQFVDATGDGDLAAAAGCGFDQGRPGDGACQPMSLLAIVTGLDPGEAAPFLVGPTPWSEATRRFRRELAAAGAPPSYRSASLFRLHGDLYFLMANHFHGADGLDAEARSEALRAGRREIENQVARLRRRGGPWRKLTLAASSEAPGVRETRRVHGRYTVTADDLLSGRRHADAVCRARYPVDVHAPRAPGAAEASVSVRAVRPYDIPLRALMARDLPNLWLAGRCISGDFCAHASYRVTGNAAPLGEAAGVAAALAAKRGDGSSVPFTEVSEVLFGTPRGADTSVLVGADGWEGEGDGHA